MLSRLSPHPFFIYAEDDQNSVVLLRAALRKLQREDTLVHCPDGESLVSRLQDSIIDHKLPEFALVDLRMPKLGGFEVLRWIRSTPAIKTLPVLILSSSALPQDVELAMALGATNYLVKPGSYSELCRLTADLLARYNLNARSEGPPA